MRLFLLLSRSRDLHRILVLQSLKFASSILCVYVCVCMWVCLYVLDCSHEWIYIHIYIYTYKIYIQYIYIIYIYIIYINIYIYIHIYVYVYVYVALTGLLSRIHLYTSVKREVSALSKKRPKRETYWALLVCIINTKPARFDQFCVSACVAFLYATLSDTHLIYVSSLLLHMCMYVCVSNYCVDL